MFIKVSDLASVEKFKNESKKGYWVILYYAEWCPHCQTLKPEWNKFTDKYSSSKEINVAEVESEFLGSVGDEHKNNVEGYPTIVSCNKGVKTGNFMGDRTSQAIDDFANSNLKESSNNSNNINKLLGKNLLNLVKKTKQTKRTKSKKSKTSKSKKSKKSKSKKSKSNNSRK